MRGTKGRAVTIWIVAESVGHDIRPDTVSARVDAEIGATAIVNQTFVNVVGADSAVEFALVHDTVIDNLLERRTAEREGNSTRDVEP